MRHFIVALFIALVPFCATGLASTFSSISPSLLLSQVGALAPVQVLEPVEGATYSAGDTINIKWSQSSVTQYMVMLAKKTPNPATGLWTLAYVKPNVHLEPNKQGDNVVFYNNTGQISWTIPAGEIDVLESRGGDFVRARRSIAPGDDYIIQIFEFHQGIMPEGINTGGRLLGESKTFSIRSHLSGPVLHPQYKTFSVDVQGPNVCENDTTTFTDYRLDVVFTNGSKSVTVPGYFAGDGSAMDDGANTNSCGSTWRAYFVPNAGGTWNYRATLYNGSGVAFAQAPSGVSVENSGSFQAQSAAGEPGFLSKGLLRYVGEHYLRFDDGEYFLKVGVGSPENFLAYSGFDGGGRHDYSSHGGIKGAVDYLSGQGMNAIYMLTMNVAGDGKDVFPWVDRGYKNVGFKSTPSSEQKAGMLNYDLSKLAQWNDLFDYLDRKGMMAHLLLTETENESIFEQNPRYGDQSFDNARKVYYREMVARFGHHRAVAFNLGEENGWNDGGGVAAPNNTAQRKAFAQYINNLDPYDRLITVHSEWTTGARHAMFDALIGDRNFTGASLQLFASDIPGDIARWRSRSAGAGQSWVITTDEVAPADGSGSSNTDFNTARQQVMWPVAMLGGAGFDQYFGDRDQNFNNFSERSGFWSSAGNMIKFFKENNIPFWAMTSGGNSFSGLNGGFSMVKSGEYYVAYLPRGSSNLSLNLNGVSGAFKATWYDPVTGVNLGTRDVNGGGTVSLAFSQTNKEVALVVVKNGDQPIDITPPVTGAGIYQIGETVELENLTLPTDTSDGGTWQRGSSVSGFSGSGYVVYSKLGASNTEVHNPESVDQAFGFKVNVPTSGLYAINVRAQHRNPRADTENDSWVRVKRASESTPTPWLKFYTPAHTTNNWSEDTRSNTTSGENPNDYLVGNPAFSREAYPAGNCCIAFYFYLNAGENEIQFSARSNNHYLDWAKVSAVNNKATLTASSPTISSISPTSGTVGATVTITGRNFTATNNNVVVNNTNIGRFDSTKSGTSIDITIPSLTPSAPTTDSNRVKIKVVSNNLSSNEVDFTILPSAPVVLTPTISSISPSSGPFGTRVTIVGKNFAAMNTVKINGTSIGQYSGTNNGTNIVISGVPYVGTGPTPTNFAGDLKVQVVTNNLTSNEKVFRITPQTTPGPSVTSLSVSAFVNNADWKATKSVSGSNLNQKLINWEWASVYQTVNVEANSTYRIRAKVNYSISDSSKYNTTYTGLFVASSGSQPGANTLCRDLYTTGDANKESAFECSFNTGSNTSVSVVIGQWLKDQRCRNTYAGTDGRSCYDANFTVSEVKIEKVTSLSWLRFGAQMMAGVFQAFAGLFVGR